MVRSMAESLAARVDSTALLVVSSEYGERCGGSDTCDAGLLSAYGEWSRGVVGWL